MITDEQFKSLEEKYKRLEQKYAQMSQDIASIKMKMDMARTRVKTEQVQVRKDVTRYVFDGEQYDKRHLVLECIRKYIADSGVEDAAELMETFPDYIQGSLGVIRSAEDAEKYSGATERYFFGDEDVLHLNDGIYVVSKDWTVKNISRFVKMMEKLGYEIKTINREY